MDDTYNGWRNYETWNVKLWMDNDERDYNFFRDFARHYWKSSEPQYDWQTKEQAVKASLAKALEEYYEENNPLGTPDLASTYSDLLGSALSMVDWYEIAESLIEDMAEAA